MLDQLPDLFALNRISTVIDFGIIIKRHLQNLFFRGRSTKITVIDVITVTAPEKINSTSKGPGRISLRLRYTVPPTLKFAWVFNAVH